MLDLIATDDAALSALFWPMRSGVLAWPAGARLFMGARPGDWPDELHHDLMCAQDYKPYADLLAQQGHAVEACVTRMDSAITLLLPPRSRDASRAMLARAICATAEGGWVLASATNDEGGRSLAADVGQLLAGTQQVAKFKSRTAFARNVAATRNEDLLQQWLALDAPRAVHSPFGPFCSRPGLFAWDRVDAASALLAAHLPASLSGRVADLGAGWGFLSMQVTQRCPSVTTLDLFEADARALAPAQQNLAAALSSRPQVAVNVHWHDVTQGLPGRYDVIVSNPPFHVGRADFPALGRAFIARAAEALVATGQLWLVANRHLPYEAALSERFAHIHTVVQSDGFKIINAREPRA